MPASMASHVTPQGVVGVVVLVSDLALCNDVLQWLVGRQNKYLCKGKFTRSACSMLFGEHDAVYVLFRLLQVSSGSHACRFHAPHKRIDLSPGMFVSFFWHLLYKFCLGSSCPNHNVRDAPGVDTHCLFRCGRASQRSLCLFLSLLLPLPSE